MITGLLRLFGRGWISLGLGGKGNTAPVTVFIPACAHVSLTPRIVAKTAIEPRVTATISLEPRVVATTALVRC